MISFVHTDRHIPLENASYNVYKYNPSPESLPLYFRHIFCYFDRERLETSHKRFPSIPTSESRENKRP